ncbi:MAG TPA: amidohydrolase [Daejeonella sp.]|nr:amidohydrolase [Daejeonella sp.]
MTTTQHYINGKIFTGKSESEFVTAFKVADGKIEWVGSSEEVKTVNAINLQGKTVLPGFLDVHTHPVWVANILQGVPCIIPFVRNIDGMIKALRNSQQAGQGEHVWIEGWGYDESKLAELRTPTVEDLDQVSATQPVFVYRSDCHSSICNTKALQLAGITKDTPNPPHGIIGRFENGEPNGVLTEFSATKLILNCKPVRGFEEDAKTLAGAAEHYNKRGIVAMTDLMGLENPYSYSDLYRRAEELGLKQNTVIYPLFSELKAAGISEIAEENKNGLSKIGGVKLFLDGTISSRSAWIKEPYTGTSDFYGAKTEDEDVMREAFDYAKRNNIQLAIHAMGDASIQLIIDLFKDEEPWIESRPPVRIEHVTLISQHQLDPIKGAKMKFGLIPQMIFFFAEYDSYRANLTDEQFAKTYAIKSMYDTCEYVAVSSDAPATPWAEPDDVFISIQALVTRIAAEGQDIVQAQKLTVPQAVLLYTGKAHDIALLPNVGKIQPGFDASFIVLTDDIFTVPTNKIGNVQVENTYIRGERVWG